MYLSGMWDLWNINTQNQWTDSKFLIHWQLTHGQFGIIYSCPYRPADIE